MLDSFSFTSRMPSPASTPKIVQFGVFELDLQRAELRKQGVKIKLQEQPLRVLRVLLENPGQVVSRDELRQRVWSANTFVEFDQGLYSAMARLRDVLGDSSDSPRFIETVARRGYRFIAPVSPSVAPNPGETTTPRKGEQQDSRRQSLRRWISNLLAGLLGGALLLVIVFTFDVAGAREWLRTRTTPIRSIAVLPLENLSRDPEQEYFADGMTDELITTLAQMGTVRVVSRTSVMRYKKISEPIAQVGRELSVDAVVEGTVERSGNRVRIRVQLIQAASDRHLWAQSYDRDFTDALAFESEVAGDIVREIQSDLTPTQKRRWSAVRRVAPEAYDAYLKGLYFSNKRNAADFTRAIGYFNQAIAKDSGYAAAYSGLSDALLGEIFTGTPAEKVREKATLSAQKAIELDPSSAEAHNSLGGIREFWDWDWAAAEREYRRAIELNPNFAAGHQDYALLLAFQGRFEQAIAEAQRSQDLDPLSPFVRTTFCLELEVARRYAEAVEKCQQALELDPNFRHAHGNLVSIYIAMGKNEQAVEEYEKVASLAGRSPAEIAGIRGAFEQGGSKGFWRKLLEDSKKEGDGVRVASLYALLGEKDQAMLWLEKAYRQRSPMMEFLKEASEFDNLRSDPRFGELLRRVGLGT
ncbi:MAG: winged helix-turn-helix domain-containing tetratricopeptide repeat protein [Acidobacteriota bacterium]